MCYMMRDSETHGRVKIVYLVCISGTVGRWDTALNYITIYFSQSLRCCGGRIPPVASQKIVKKLSKVVKKLSNNCQKIVNSCQIFVKKLSKSCQMLAQFRLTWEKPKKSESSGE
jgi:hypothetical protein